MSRRSTRPDRLRRQVRHAVSKYETICYEHAERKLKAHAVKKLGAGAEIAIDALT